MGPHVTWEGKVSRHLYRTNFSIKDGCEGLGARYFSALMRWHLLDAFDLVHYRREFVETI